jgi:hypothetical protein
MSSIDGSRGDGGPQADVIATSSIQLLDRYIFPLDSPPEPGSTIISDSGLNLVWEAAAGSGNVNFLDGSVIAGNICRFTDTSGLIISDSGLAVSNVATNPNNNDSNTSVGPEYKFQKTRGNGGVLVNDELGKITYSGYDATLGFNIGSEIISKATETWTGGANGSSLTIATADDGANVPTDKIIFNSEGIVLKNDLQFGDSPAYYMREKGSGDGIETYDQNNIKQLAIDDDGVFARKLKIENETTFNGPLIISSVNVPDIKVLPDGGAGISFIDLQNPDNPIDEYYLSIAPDLYASYDFRAGQTGHRTTHLRGRGTSFAQRQGLLEFDRIAEINTIGVDSSGNQGFGTIIYSICEEDWVSAQHGCKFQIRTTDIGNVSPSVKLEIGTAGIDCKDDVLANSGVLKINSNAGTPILEFQQGGLTRWSQTGNASDYKITDNVKNLDVITLTDFSPGQEHLTSKATNNYFEGQVEFNTSSNTYKFPLIRPLNNAVLKATDNNGTLSWVNASYGELYFVNPNITPVTMPMQNVYYPITPASNFGVGPLSNFTFISNTSRIIYTGVRPRIFNVTVSVAWFNSGVTPQIFGLGVGLNGVLIPSSGTRATLDDSTLFYPRNASTSCLIELNGGDTIGPVVSCLTTADACGVTDTSMTVVAVN